MTDTRWRKAWKDLAERKARSLTTLFGLVIGLWGIGAVTVAWVVLGNDLSENFRRTLPPALVIETTPGPLPNLAGLTGVLAIDNRPRLSGRMEIAPDRWMPFQGFVVDDFHQLDVARFWPEAGDFPPPPGQIVIERSGDILLRFARARPTTAKQDGHGQHVLPARKERRGPGQLRIQLEGGVEISTLIAGQVFDPAQAPSNMELLIHAYLTRETAARWLPDGVPNRLVARLERGREPRDAAAELRARLTAAGLEVTAVEFPPTDAHVHQFQMNSILFLLTGLGLMAFAMGAVLVVNLVSGILTNQFRQIGALKAIGATTGQVTGIYLKAMLVLGLASALLTLPLAERGGYFIARNLAGMLNFDILTRTLPGRVYLVLLAVGVLFPVAVAWWPVRRWCGVAVRDALDNQGVRAHGERGSLIDRVRLPLPVDLRAGVRNALRRPPRLIPGTLTVAVGALVFMMAMNMRSSLLYTAEVEEATVLYDVAVSFADDVSLDQVGWVVNFPVVEAVELWAAEPARPVTEDPLTAPEFTILAVPPDTQAIAPNPVAGHWPSPQDPLGVVVTHRFMNRYPHLSLGDPLPMEIAGQVRELRIVGVEKRFGPARLYMGRDALLGLTGGNGDRGRIAFLTLTADTPAAPPEFLAALEDHLALAGVPVRRIATSKLAGRVIRNHLDVIVVMLGVVAVLMLVVSGLGMASGVGTSVIERTRELGVLRAVGATPWKVFRILAAESVLVALGGWALAMALAGPLSRRLEAYFGARLVEYPFDHRASLEGMALAAVTMLLLALVAVLGPARMVNRQTVSAAVAYE